MPILFNIISCWRMEKMERSSVIRSVKNFSNKEPQPSGKQSMKRLWPKLPKKVLNSPVLRQPLMIRIRNGKIRWILIFPISVLVLLERFYSKTLPSTFLMDGVMDSWDLTEGYVWILILYFGVVLKWAIAYCANCCFANNVQCLISSTYQTMDSTHPNTCNISNQPYNAKIIG